MQRRSGEYANQDARLDIGVDDLLDPFSAYVSGVGRIGVLDADRMVTILLNPVDDLPPGGIGEGRHVLAKLITSSVCFLKRSSVLVIESQALLDVLLDEAF